MQQDARRYHVLEAVGRGGFGTVYKAELLGAGGFRKRVALKVLNPEVAQDAEFSQRLRDEARMLGLLEHPSVVRVDGLAMLGGRWTVVMEFIDGVDLKRLIQDGPVPLGPALEIAEQVASALHAAYSTLTADGAPVRLLHRDIKPSNIQLTAGGAVKVLDFGVARADFEDRESETRSRFFGSAAYMAPERLDAIDSHQGDVYAVGSVLVELLTGHAVGRTSANIDRHLGCVEPALRRLDALGDPHLTDVIAACLEYDPAARPTAHDLGRALRALRARHARQPWLRDWAERVVPPLVEARPVVNDDLSGSVLEEDSGTMDVLETALEDAPSGIGTGALPGSTDAMTDANRSAVAPDPTAAPAEPGPDGAAAASAPAEPVPALGAAPQPPAPATAPGDAARLHRAVWGLSALAGLVAVLTVTMGVVALVGPEATPDAAPTTSTTADAPSPIDVLAEEPVPVAPAQPAAENGEATDGGGARPQAAPAASPAPRPAPSAPAKAAAPAPRPRPAEPRPAARPAPSPSDRPAGGDAPGGEGASGEGRVLLATSGAKVTLVGSGGRFPPGEVPAGVYAIEASFGGEPAVSAGRLTVGEGELIQLSCRAALKRCIPRR